MVGYVSYFILFWIVVILQFVMAKYLVIGTYYPNLLLLMVIFIAVKRGSHQGQLFGFLWGLVWDVIQIGLLGSNAMLLTCAGFFTGKLSKKLDISKVPTQIVLAVLSSIWFWLGKYVLLLIFSSPEAIVLFDSGAFVQIFYNGLMAPIIFKLSDWFFALTNPHNRYCN